MAAIAMTAALALDGGHMLLNKTRLQNAVDAAALGGAKTLSQVKGSMNMASTTRTAALDTLSRNASAVGNTELATAVAGNPGTFAAVELSSSVYGPFSYPGQLSTQRFFLELRPIDGQRQPGQQSRGGHRHRRTQPHLAL
jgi:Flp pilus assembly protein TadG